jgi:SPOR domain
MAIKDRSGRNWIPGLFAAFWILLAVFSAAYLFRIVTEPQAQRAESAVASPATTAATSAPASTSSPLSEQQAETLIQASEAKDREIGELRAAVQDLSGQVTALGSRLRPLEKVLGPVAALPSSTSVTTSPPSPEPNTPIARPPELPKPSTSAPPATPPSVTVDEPKPAPQAKPVEKPVAAVPKPAAPAPEEDDASAAPPDEAAAEARPGDPSPPEEDSSATTDDPDAARESGSTETAALRPPASIPPGTTRFGIEIGSVGKQEEIKPLWRGLLTNHAALVAGLQPRRVMAPDKKWRLIAGPFSSAAEAAQACGLFKKADMPCEATVYAGDAF